MLHPHLAVFGTLTYDDENLPRTEEGHLTVRIDDGSAFIKRLRKNSGRKLRYFISSEYGDKTGRPHLHFIIFGLPFIGYVPQTIWLPSEENRKKLDAQNVQWRRYGHLEMEILRAWQCRGSISVSEFNPNRASYAAKSKYLNKGRLGEKSYFPGQEKESFRMSNRPGIGADYSKRLAESMEKHPIRTVEQGESLETAAAVNTIRIPRNGKKGRLYPIPRYLRQKLIEYRGGDIRTAEQKYHDRLLLQLLKETQWSENHDQTQSRVRKTLAHNQKRGKL